MKDVFIKNVTMGIRLSVCTYGKYYQALPQAEPWMEVGERWSKVADQAEIWGTQRGVGGREI